MSDCGDLGDTGDIDMAAGAPIDRIRPRQRPSRLTSWYRSSRPASTDRHTTHRPSESSYSSRDSYDSPSRRERSRKSHEHRHRDFEADQDALVRHREHHRQEYSAPARRGRRSRSVDDGYTSSEEEEVYDHRGERERRSDRDRRRHGDTRQRGEGEGVWEWDCE